MHPAFKDCQLMYNFDAVSVKSGAQPGLC